jgi:hypothetical protein
MQKIKIIIALVVVAALTVVIVGLAAAQTTSPNPTTSPYQGVWGWIGNCFRFRTNAPTTGNQVQTPTIPAQPSTQAPTVPNQGGYYARGYGPCWVRW